MIVVGMRVLVAEDNDLVRGALCGMLRVMSAAVVEAKSGKELINRVFGAEQFDLVVCDVFLPERSGMAVARTARAAGIATPFLFVSGQPPTKDELASVGDAAFLPKPFALRDLQEAVDSLIGR